MSFASCFISFLVSDFKNNNFFCKSAPIIYPETHFVQNQLLLVRRTCCGKFIHLLAKYLCGCYPKWKYKQVWILSARETNSGAGATRVQQRACVRGWWLLTKRLHLVGFTCPGQSSFLRWPWRGGGRCCCAAPLACPPHTPPPPHLIKTLYLLSAHVSDEHGGEKINASCFCGKK